MQKERFGAVYSFEEKEKYNFDLFTNQEPGQSARPASRK